MRPTGPRLRVIHSRTTGSDVVHMSSFGSSVRATPSTTTMVFCSSSSSGRVRMSNRPVTSNSKRQQLRHRNVFGRAAVDRLADGADRLRERFDRMMRRHVAGLEMHFRGAAIIAGDEAVQDFGEEAPLLVAEPAHDAEIDRGRACPRHRRTDFPDACRRGKSRRAWRGAETTGSRCGRAAAGRSLCRPARRDPTAACRRSIPASARPWRSGSSRPAARENPGRPWCSPPSRTARPPRAAGPFRSSPSAPAYRRLRSAAAAAPRRNSFRPCARRSRRHRDRS